MTNLHFSLAACKQLMKAANDEFFSSSNDGFQIAFSTDGGRSVYPVSERSLSFPSLFSGYLFSAANFTFCCSPKRQKLSVRRASGRAILQPFSFLPSLHKILIEFPKRAALRKYNLSQGRKDGGGRAGGHATARRCILSTSNSIYLKTSLLAKVL